MSDLFRNHIVGFPTRRLVYRIPGLQPYIHQKRGIKGLEDELCIFIDFYAHDHFLPSLISRQNNATVHQDAGMVSVSSD